MAFVLNNCISVLLEICRVSSIMHIHFCCLSCLYYIMFITMLFILLYVSGPLLVTSSTYYWVSLKIMVGRYPFEDRLVSI